jgi:hypothetical protein
MATMPSRAHTLGLALSSILPQLDRLYVYLDGHDEIPASLRAEEKIVPVLSAAMPGLRAAGKFIALTLEPSNFIFVGCDDDIAYPASYVTHSLRGLQRNREPAVVGIHGASLRAGLTSYRSGRTVFHFSDKLRKPAVVDVLGTGTVVFSTAQLRFDVGGWTNFRAADLCLAMEAARAGISLICLPRRRAYLRALDGCQPDSCYAALCQDDSAETTMALRLLTWKQNPGAFTL